MTRLLQRLVIPVVLLAAFIGATVALDRVDNEALPTAAVDAPAPAAAPVTPVFSLRRAPELLTPPGAEDELRAELQTWVDSLPGASCFVVSSGGQVIFEHQPDLPVIPASNMKILTAVAALEALGPDFTFQTRIAAATEPNADGVLEGDLFVIGGGDPILMTDAYAQLQPRPDSDVRTDANDLADQTVAANLSEIRGGIRVDESRYDTERSVDGWPQRFLDQGQVGVLGAAVIDDGFVGFADGYASQDVPRNVDPPPLPRAAEPAAQFGEVFDDLLEARNVLIASGASAVTELPDDLVDLVVWDSPPLSDIVAQMLVNSDNTTAELLVKEIGFAESEQGSTTAGTLAMSALLRNAGLADGGLFALDGSGLSEGDQVTCQLVHDALELPEHKAVLRAGMPVAGESGTLARSFRGTPGEGAIRAKTGYLARSSALSGYFTTQRGVELTFSLIINTGAQREITPADIERWQTPLAEILAPYPPGPPLEQLGPVGAAVGD